MMIFRLIAAQAKRKKAEELKDLARSIREKNARLVRSAHNALNMVFSCSGCLAHSLVC